MPSVQLSRLREQITQLFGLVDRPEEFRRALRDLLEKHSEHAYRSGESIPPPSLLPSYRVPPLVSRQLEIELSSATTRTPSQLLLVADSLWTDNYLEPRIFSTLILSRVPISHVEDIILRIKAWAKPDEDRLVLAALLDQGSNVLRTAAPVKFLDLIHSWLDENRLPYKQMGLRTLESMVNDPDFDNIPPFFRLLTPLVLAPAPQLMNNLHHCLQALAHKSPGETAFFLHQVIGSSADTNTARLIRRVIPEFPETLQENLRSALRNRSTV